DRFQQDFEAFLRQFPQSSERARPKAASIAQDPTEPEPTPNSNGEGEPPTETTPSTAEAEEPLEATIERIVQEQLDLHNEALFATLPPPPADATASEGGNLWGFAKQSLQAVAGLLAAIVRLALLAFLIP